MQGLPVGSALVHAGHPLVALFRDFFLSEERLANKDKESLPLPAPSLPAVNNEDH